MRLIHSTLLPWCLLLLACQPAPSSQAAALGDYATLEQLAQAFREVSANYPVQPRSMPPTGRRQFVQQVFAAAGYDYTATLEAVARATVDVSDQHQRDLLDLLFLPHQGIAPADWEAVYSARELEALRSIQRGMR